ncbi:DNA polymerase III subunit gamma/tau [Candidatus Gottesmanbacteria bacterium]|nr:DNA polymerase III subunit gamma/tau [Candidatus Gottesmanbacteria bacterium]
MTLYRKYRPQKLEELDLVEIRKRLSVILSSDNTPHAFLFAGPKGTGKTSAARIVAKILNCEQSNSNQSSVVSDRLKTKEPKTDNRKPIAEVEPCNKCETCISITEGRNLDILEIDAASNRGIDEIRDLREKIKLAPAGTRYKIYIIDEVHMLTTEAFNALLKTLEEPPLHAVFILATTEADKLLPTIISRCTRLDFKRANIDEIVHSLKRVVKGEGLEIDNEGEILEMIASVSDGSFRDATKILEQAVLEKALGKDSLKKIIGDSGNQTQKLLTLLLDKDSQKTLELLEGLAGQGTNMRIFTSAILNYLHKLLLAKHGLATVDDADLEKFSTSDINDLIKIFSRVYGELRTTAIPQLPMELAVVEWCEGKHAN